MKVSGAPLITELESIRKLFENRWVHIPTHQSQTQLLLRIILPISIHLLDPLHQLNNLHRLLLQLLPVFLHHILINVLIKSITSQLIGTMVLLFLLINSVRIAIVLAFIEKSIVHYSKTGLMPFILMEVKTFHSNLTRILCWTLRPLIILIKIRGYRSKLGVIVSKLGVTHFHSTSMSISIVIKSSSILISSQGLC